MSKIEWTEETWNPLVGCSKVSPGCKNCYAIRMAYRLSHNPKMGGRYAGTVEKTVGGKLNWTGQVDQIPDTLNKPLNKKKPTLYFVNSMSDLFHDSVPFEYIAAVYGVMMATPQHTYQVLTKRPERMLEFYTWLKTQEEGEQHTCEENGLGYVDGCLLNADSSPWPLPNVWIGVSCENQQTADERIPLLLQVPAAIRFLSCEPLLGPVDLLQIKAHEECEGEKWTFNCLDTGDIYTLHADGEMGGAMPGDGPMREAKIDWVIVGGESGPEARPMHPGWVRSLRDQCQATDTAFFFKQWGEWMQCTFTDLPASKGRGLCCFFPGASWPSDGNWNEEVKPGVINMRKMGKKKSDRMMDGRTWDEMPVSI